MSGIKRSNMGRPEYELRDVILMEMIELKLKNPDIKEGRQLALQTLKASQYKQAKLAEHGGDLQRAVDSMRKAYKDHARRLMAERERRTLVSVPASTVPASTADEATIEAVPWDNRVIAEAVQRAVTVQREWQLAIAEAVKNASTAQQFPGLAPELWAATPSTIILPRFWNVHSYSGTGAP